MKRGGIPLRRAQLVTTFGPGALTITPDGFPLVVSGLDEWFKSWPNEDSSPRLEDYVFHDRRLESRLKVSAFRLPPDYRAKPSDRGKPNYKLPVPSYLFPRWYACSRCGRLKCFQPNHVESRRLRRDNEEILCRIKSKVSQLDCSKSPGRFRPVPLLALCDQGHIQDFPFRQWVHKSSQPACGEPMYIFGLGGAVEQQTIKCGCGRERRLAGILEENPNADPPSSLLSDSLLEKGGLYVCRGLKAWVGAVQEHCDRPLVGALSTGTNVYYSDVRSSIYLPVASAGTSTNVRQEVLMALQSPSVEYLYRNLPVDTPASQLQWLGTILAQQTGLPADEAVEGLRYLITIQDQDENADQDLDYDERHFRVDEYRVFTGDQAADNDYLIVERADTSPWIDKYFSRVALVRRLRETRALVGFSRLRPPGPMPLSRKRRMLWRSEPARVEERWLPGYFVHGEGIFLELRRDIAKSLTGSAATRQRLQRARPSRILDRSPLFVALHTLAHLLIRRLSFECGYGSASLRERLYVLTEPLLTMHGILVYTAQSDSEGSMGGLVRMGAPNTLERVVRQAIEEALWCSSDPVCREIGGESGQGPDNLNGAACHACCHLPETSCECYNLLLDRNILVGDAKGSGALFQVQWSIVRNSRSPEKR